MTEYEILLLLDPDASEDRQNEIVTRILRITDGVLRHMAVRRPKTSAAAPQAQAEPEAAVPHEQDSAAQPEAPPEVQSSAPAEPEPEPEVVQEAG